MRVLVVGAVPGEVRTWVGALRRAGLATDGLRTRAAALRALAEVDYDAVVAEQDLADGDGRDVLDGARPEAAVLAVAPPGDRSAALDALAAGADDALVPPFRVEELVLRVAKALVRRTEPSGRNEVQLGPLVVDRSARTVHLAGTQLHLTPTGLCILDHLLAHRHRLVPEGELLEHCWDARRRDLSDPLPSQLNRLRALLAGSVVIRFVDRGGYILDAPARSHGDGLRRGASGGRV